MKPASDLAPGTVLSGTYEIVRLLGAGGMGAVYEARHLRLEGRRVAVKVLLRDLASDAEVFARFKREAEIGARLGHPHIINVTDWDKLPDGSPFMVMEFLAGEDLAARMVRGPLEAREIYALLREVGAALHATHKQGIVHRDLKPQNIFLVPVEEPEGIVHHAKVLDFGISKIAASQTVVTRESAVLGTPQYMAPEQALGKSGEIDARTDQFALAAIAYELFAGKPAFHADSVTAVLFKIVYESPRPLSEVSATVPAHVATAVERAMAKDRDGRFPDVMAFVNAVLDETGSGSAARSTAGGRSTGALAARGSSTMRQGSGGLGPSGAASTKANSSVHAGDGDDGDAASRPRAPGGAAQSRRVMALVAIGVASLAVVGGGFLFLRRGASPPAATGTSTVATAPLPPPLPSALATPPAPPPTLPPSLPMVATAAPANPPPQPPLRTSITFSPPGSASTKASTKTRPPVSTKEHAGAAPGNADARAKLDEAAAAYQDANYQEAIRRARQSLTYEKSARANRIIAESYCAMHDLGGSQSALHAVDAADKRTVLTACKKAGLDL